MSWLTYSKHEINCFHPAFEILANQALSELGLDGGYKWEHHVRTDSNPGIPDYVLLKQGTNRWVLAVEIKRTREAVCSSRTKIQAKSYAESNYSHYDSSSPKYFATTNLELSELFALNGSLPPNDCKIENGSFESGDFTVTPVEKHKAAFVKDMKAIISTVINEKVPKFENVWPRVLREWEAAANSLSGSHLAVPTISLSPTAVNVVENYFSPEIEADAAKMLFLRCLLLEYLKGVLIKYGHSGASKIPPLTDDVPTSLVKAFAKLREVDFESIFSQSTLQSYRSITDKGTLNKLKEYVAVLNQPGAKVAEFAKKAGNACELVDSLFTCVHPIEAQNRRGKIQTDPELAAVLAHLAIGEVVENVVDPCCGEGSLLSAAYDRLVGLGLKFEEALRVSQGVEVDFIPAQLAALRLTLKEPKSLKPSTMAFISRDDMFARWQLLRAANVVLMNPPFKRYENQDGHPIPGELRQYYAEAIERVGGEPAKTIGAQANIYNYYVEFVTKCVKSGTRVAIILDNKWYNNSYGRPLKDLFLGNYNIKGIFEYPHSAFFKKWIIATSIIIAERVETPDPENIVKFVRTTEDPRLVDLEALSRAFIQGDGEWPMHWRCVEKRQKELKAKDGWKSNFSAAMENDFLAGDWPALTKLFASVRSGRPDREGGGTIVYTFPVGLTDYGPRREFSTKEKKGRYTTDEGAPLTAEENAELRALAAAINPDFLGYAVRNSKNLSGYEISIQDVTKCPIIEPPSLRGRAEYVDSPKKAKWQTHHDQALKEIYSERSLRKYIRKVMQKVNMTKRVLPRNNLWFILREPAAGELILNRKLREGHRVHINPFAFDAAGRQVRISSNFLSLATCKATDDNSGLDRKKATYLIAAFLMSSFGQLQFEREGQNREGLLAVEEHQVERIRVFDPRWIRPENRDVIIAAFKSLPYPIKAELASAELTERNHLDDLFADEIVFRNNSLGKDSLLKEVHDELEEWITSRQP